MTVLVDSYNININIPSTVKEKDTPPISQRLLSAFKSGNFTYEKKGLLNDFAKIKPADLKHLLDDCFQDLAATHSANPFSALEQLAETIPFEKLQEAVGTKPEEALAKAKNMLHQAKYYLETTDQQTSPTLRSRLLDVLDTLISFIETILTSFGIADFFKPATSQMQNQFKFQKITMLISFTTMLSATLFPLLGLSVAAPIIGGVLLLIGVLSVIYPHICPIPSQLPYAKNWTKLCRQGKLGDLSIAHGRKNILNEVAKTLIQNQTGQIKKHPLLIGKSRVGKTQTAQSFVKAVEQGDYPELSGKKIFYLNASKLLKNGDQFVGKDPLEQIGEGIGRHGDNIIIVIDEIHTIFQGERTMSHGLGQKMKEMLDPNGELPLVIGITTSQEFLTHIHSDEAFVNRFNPITLENTDAVVTEEILTHTLLANHQNALCEKGALQSIYQKTSDKNLAQPYYSLLTLQECVKSTSTAQQPSIVKEIEGLNNQKALAVAQQTSSFDMDDPTDRISELESRIKKLSTDCALEKIKLQHLFKAKESLSAVKKKTYLTVMKINEVQEEKLTPHAKIKLNEWTLLSRFLVPALKDFVQKRSDDMNIPVIINDVVVDAALKTLEDREERKSAALQQAQKEKHKIADAVK